MDWVIEELANLTLGDKRLNKRAQSLLFKLSRNATDSMVVGIIGHSQGMQKRFQSNTVKDRKIFSYFTLGQLIIEHDKLDQINYHENSLFDILQEELARKW